MKNGNRCYSLWVLLVSFRAWNNFEHLYFLLYVEGVVMVLLGYWRFLVAICAYLCVWKFHSLFEVYKHTASSQHIRKCEKNRQENNISFLTFQESLKCPIGDGIRSNFFQ